MLNFNFQIFYLTTHHMKERTDANQKRYNLWRAKKYDIIFLTIIGGSLQNTSHWIERYENKEMNGSESNEAIIHFGRNKKKNLLQTTEIF